MGNASRSARRLRRAPVVRLLLVVQVPDACNQRSVPVLLRPVDRSLLRVENGKGMIRVILDNVVLNWAALRPALRARLYVNVGHGASSLVGLCESITPGNRPWRHRERVKARGQRTPSVGSVVGSPV